MSNINKPCNVCRSSSFAPVDGTVRGLPKMKIFRCNDCGLVFLEDFDHIDSKFYENSNMRSKNVNSWKYYLNMCDKDDSRRLDHLKNSLENRKLLDFGCGAGGFLLKAKVFTEFPVMGIEPDNFLREKLLEQKINNLSVVAELKDLEIQIFYHIKNSRKMISDYF